MGSIHLCPSPPTGAQRKATEQASEADRRWFLAHPDRNHRMRRALFAEVPAHPDLLAFVLVKQVQPGVRARTALYVPTPPPYEPDEAESAWAWRTVMSTMDGGADG